MMPNYNDPPSYPTPYVATVSKVLQSGKVTIEGNSAETVEDALENLRETRAQYYASGSWGGPGLILLCFALSQYALIPAGVIV